MFFSFRLCIFAAEMNDKKDFLRKVTPLFWKFGAKTLTMDEIAREFSISKKTLYQNYPNKESMLKEVLAYTLDTIVEQVEKVNAQYQNPIEALLNTHNDMEVFMTENDNVFVRQLAKFYDKILDEHKINVFKKMQPVFGETIKKGQDMGLYRKDFNADAYFKFLLQLFFSMEDSPLFCEERNKEDVLCISIVDFYLNSILTEKGRQNYNELKLKYE